MKEHNKSLKRKKKSDPQLFTPNAYLQHKLGLAEGGLKELSSRRFESLLCEQILNASGASAKYIQSLRDSDGYLLLEDIEDLIPYPFAFNDVKRLSLEDCIHLPLSKLLWDDIESLDDDLVLGAVQWTSGYGKYAQLGVFRAPRAILSGHYEGPLIVRGDGNSMYYFGRFFTLMTALVSEGIQPLCAESLER